MTKKGIRAEVNTFVQGIITEASPLNFPPNATKDEENFELNTDGTRDRRLGMDNEIGHTNRDVVISAEVPKVYCGKWLSVNNQPGLDFVVVWYDKTLHFSEDDGGAQSGASYKGFHQIPEGGSITSVASIDGKLVVVNDHYDVWAITYNPDTNSFLRTRVYLKVRDIWGVEETVESIYEQSNLTRANNSDQHKYNSYNQGWALYRTYKDGTPCDPYLKFGTDLGVYPSNSDVVWTGLQFQPATGTGDPSERFYPNIYLDVAGASGVAARGYYTINPLRRGVTRPYGAAVLPTDTTLGGPTVVCEFAGRVFYAGMNGKNTGSDARSPSMMNHVLFSQVVSGIQTIGKCYQEGDPTSRDSSDIVDTDGGVIKIAGAKNVLAMRNIESHLVVLASNGVWAISGGGNYGFSATNYKVTKISTFGVIDGNSVVVQGGRIYYWGEDGIYIIDKDQMGDLTSKSITQSTIHTLYAKIPTVSKQNVRGEYDPYARKIRWVFNEGSGTTAVNKELVFDVVLGAFYINRIYGANLGFYVVGIVPVKSYTISPVRVGDRAGVLYLALKKNSVTGMWRYTFSKYRDDTFRDWATDGLAIDAKAYMFTGEVTGGDSSAYKQVPYMVMHFKKTETFVDGSSTPLHQSSCMVRCAWDWANTEASNRWSSLFQAYRFRQAMFYTTTASDNDNGYETVVSKNKLRGRGRAFSLYMETSPLKDCRIIGWSLTLNGNANV